MITPDLTLSNKTRYQRSVQDYIGTLPEQPNTLTGLLNLNPQSRYQVTENTANQTELTYKFNTFGWKHTALAGVEVSREISSIDRYTGLSSEALGNQERRAAPSQGRVSSIRSTRISSPPAARNGQAFRPESPSIPRASMRWIAPTTTTRSSSTAAFATITMTSRRLALVRPAASCRPISGMRRKCEAACRTSTSA